jgi:hypothetical protein
VPRQAPPLQVSPTVQKAPSSHGAVLAVCVQPLAGAQPSVVHGLPSLQLGAEPPTQLPPLQVSPVVQAFPSSQGAVLGVCTHPLAGLQLSFVHTLPSLQLGAGPPPQLPPLQVSLVVQAFPSLQGALFGTWVQPVAGAHPSVVQPLASSHGTGSLTQACATQRSLVVQWSVSAQSALVLQQPASGACWQPLAGLQLSAVQVFPSLQSVGGPPAQPPPLQTSPVVQGFPSSQDTAFGTCVHPLAGVHPSVVHRLPSLQLGGGPP